jgi:hypothetical protein
MSGGYFDYNQYRIQEIADTLRSLSEGENLEFLRDVTESSDGDRKQSEENLKDFLITIGFLADQLEACRIAVHRIDWLLSWDDSYETFVERLQEDVDKFEEGL